MASYISHSLASYGMSIVNIWIELTMWYRDRTVIALQQECSKTADKRQQGHSKLTHSKTSVKWTPLIASLRNTLFACDTFINTCGIDLEITCWWSVAQMVLIKVRVEHYFLQCSQCNWAAIWQQQHNMPLTLQQHTLTCIHAYFKASQTLLLLKRSCLRVMIIKSYRKSLRFTGSLYGENPNQTDGQ